MARTVKGLSQIAHNGYGEVPKITVGAEKGEEIQEESPYVVGDIETPFVTEEAEQFRKQPYPQRFGPSQVILLPLR